ncbi:MAG: di-heme oxidoredictase family protein, partial [Myxococcota bacterium]
GTEQTDCGNTAGPELPDEQLSHLVKYVSLLGVRARRHIDDPAALRGEALFTAIGCGGCHRSEVMTGPHHPLAELRNQRIHPYTDLLLHDMGPGLADTLGEGDATGAEWRTAPLWGLGLGPCVTGGVVGPHQQQVCEPHASYLHDGRARTITEAILWHGGEAQAAKQAFEELAAEDREALLRFLESL